METVALHGPRLGVGRRCKALALPRATYYRHLEAQAPRPRPTPARALTAVERQDVLAALHEPRFVDLAPAEVHARLLDEGRYLCSERTMYRVLSENAEVRERRDQLRHPEYTPAKSPPGASTGTAAVADREKSPRWIPKFNCYVRGQNVRIVVSEPDFAIVSAGFLPR